jgi:acetoin utilization protein AcuB
MYVGWVMKTKLVTATPDTPILKAREIMDSHNIAHLPVTDGKAHLLGIITDRDLKQAWASSASTLSVYELTYVLQKLSVENVMVKKVITATPDMTIERAARFLHDNRIGALPVVENGKLVGIITTRDLMESLLDVLGMSDDSGRVSLLVRDRMGVLAEVGRIMQKEGINIRSVVIVPLKSYDDVGQLIMRVNIAVHPRAVEALREAGFKPITEYVEDLSPYLPV